MKKGYAYLCAFLLMTAGVFAQTAVPPLSEDFELESQAGTGCTPSSGITLASTLFNNDQTDQNEWRPDLNGTGSTGTGPSTDHSATGPGFYLYTETSGCYGQTVNLESVYMNWTSITSGYVQAWYHMYGAAMGTMHFDIRIGSGAWTLDYVPSWTDNQNLWQLKAITVNDTNYAGKDSVQIRFRGVTGTSFTSDMALDDISVTQAPSCVAPSVLSSSNLTSTSADLAWTENNSATQWEIEYGMSPLTFGTGTRALISSNPYTLTGLSANTDYDWYVRSICAAADSSTWGGPSSFRTPCSPFTSPYSTGFDATLDPVVDPCWTVVNTTGTIAAIVTENLGSDPQRSAPNSIEFYNYNATTGHLLLVSPQLSDLDNTKQIRFWLQNEANTAYTAGMIIGTMSDPAVDTTFEPYDTIPNALFMSNTWVEFVINFNNLTNGDKYIAFQPEFNASFDYIWMDDFLYQPIPSCPQPSFLSANNVSYNAADLAWTENGSATTWQIEYDSTGFAQGTGTMMMSTTNPQAITGLTSEATYDWYVRSICGPADTSAWSGPNSFTTLCAPASTPWSDDVESHTATTNLSSSLCWTATANNTTNDWNIDGSGSTPSSGTGPLGANSGTKYFYFEASGGTAGNEAYLETPLIDLTNLTVPRLTFFYHMYGAQNGVMADLFVDIWDGTSYTTVDSIIGEQQANQADPFLKRIISLSSYSGVIGVRFTAKWNGAQWGDISLDDFAVEETPNCPAPSALNIDSKSSTTATLSWNENGTATNWQIQYDTAGFTPGTGNLMLTTNNPETITGLMANTDYQWYVRSICGVADTSAWTGPATFFTGYCTPAPTSVDGTGITNVSFGTVNNTTGAEPGNYADYTNLSGDAIQGVSTPLDITFSTGFTYATLVYIDWNNDLDFDDTLETVYSGTSLATNPTTLNASFTVPAGQPLGQYRMRIGGADVGPPTPCYSGSWASFEDYTVNVITPPSCLFPGNLSAMVTSDSVRLSWSDPNAATMWEVEWDTVGYTLGAAANSVIVSNDTFYTIMNLAPTTDYAWAVRAICAPADSSSWSVNSFSTPIAGPQGFTCITGNPSIVFTDDLEATAGWTGNIGTGTTLNNWNYRTGGTGSTGTGPNGAHSGNQYVYVETSGATVGTNVNFISPAIDLSGGLNFAELSFWVHAIGGNIGTLNVGIDTSATGTFPTVWTYSGPIQTAQADPYQNVGVNLDAYVGQTIYIRFNYVTNGSFRGDIALDLIEVSTCTSCSAPSNLTSANVGLTSADLGWTENGTATTWELEYGPLGFTPGAGTKVVTTTNPYSATGLTASTSYDFYVRAICGAADTSGASPAGGFATLNGVPYSQDFENFGTGTGVNDEGWTNASGVAPIWSIGTSTGSSGTGPTVDHTIGTGGKFAFLETSGSYPALTPDTLFGPTILTGVGDSLLELSFWYHMHGATMGDLQVWVAGAVNGPMMIGTISGQQQVNQTDPWLESVNLVSGFQNDTVRIVFVGLGTVFTSDMAIDDVSLDLPPANNLAMNVVSSPTSGCGLSATESVTVAITNLGSAAQTGFSVGYSLNGVAITPETYTGTISPNTTVNYTYTTTANLSAAGQYNITAFTMLAGDVNTSNDTASTEVNSIASAVLPYAESFESGPADWFVTGTNSSWDLGTPAGVALVGAAHGDSAWATGLSFNYNNGEEGYLNSPCFDLTGTTNPWITFNLNWDIEFQWDGALMQVSTNGGSSWSTLGILGDTLNWYNDTADVINALGIDPTGQSWTGTGTNGSGGWINAGHELSGLIGQSSVRFRLLFASDGAVVEEGIAFDNVRVFDSLPPTGIEAVAAMKTQLNIFPNPTTGMVTIQANDLNSNDARITVRDLSGKILFEDRIIKTEFSTTLDFSDRAKGIYFITIMDGDNMINEKLIKN